MPCRDVAHNLDTNVQASLQTGSPITRLSSCGNSSQKLPFQSRLVIQISGFRSMLQPSEDSSGEVRLFLAICSLVIHWPSGEMATVLRDRDADGRPLSSLPLSPCPSLPSFLPLCRCIPCSFPLSRLSATALVRLDRCPRLSRQTGTC